MTIRLKTELFVKQIIKNDIIISIFFSLIKMKGGSSHLHLESYDFCILKTVKKLQKYVCYLVRIFYLSGFVE